MTTTIHPSPIPITLLTGFLGSGKTTLLLNLLPQLRSINPTYKLALLKNEFGDVAIDSQLASSSSISAVSELLGGCICCNLVGSLSTALEELEDAVAKSSSAEGQKLNRIIIETSGSAFPATLAMEINRISTRTSGKYILDGVISVIDVENWKGYEDTSYTARLQARYTDLVVFNKWEGVEERRWEECLDRLGDLGVETAWVRSKKGWVDVNVAFGVDAGLLGEGGIEGSPNREANARKLVDGEDEEGVNGHAHEHEHAHTNGTNAHEHDHQSEVEVLSLTLTSPVPNSSISLPALTKLLTSCPKDEVYRIKAVLSSSVPIPSSDPTPTPTQDPKVSNGTMKPQRYILNWAFGRWTSTLLPASLKEDVSSTQGGQEEGEQVVLRMTMVFAREESTKWRRRIEGGGFVEVETGEEEGSGRGNLRIERIV